MNNIDVKRSRQGKWNKSKKKGGKTFNFKTLKEFEHCWTPTSILFQDSSDVEEHGFDLRTYHLPTPSNEVIPDFDRLWRKDEQQGILHLVRHLVSLYKVEEGNKYVVQATFEDRVYQYEVGFTHRKRYDNNTRFSLTLMVDYLEHDEDDYETIWLFFDINVKKMIRENEEEGGN